MKKLNKIILSGIAALLMSCSEEAVLPDIADEGATTEPSSVANLTDEQKAILARSLISLADPSMADSLERMFDSLKVSMASDLNRFYYNYINTITTSVKTSRVYSYPSKDGRKVCDVVTFSKENGLEKKGVLRATSYDEYDHDCYIRYDRNNKCSEGDADRDYFNTHRNEAIEATRIVYVDETPVVISTMGSRKMSNSFWGYGVSCAEKLNQFKKTCSDANGLFWDFGDGCSHEDLELVCASFVPEGQAWYDVLNDYTALYENQCLEDSIKYAPFDDENYVPIDPNTYQPYLDSLNRVADAERQWANTLKRTTYAYKWQFSIIDSTIRTALNGSGTYLTYKEYPELSGYLGIGYNTLPDSPVADAYRKEGVYVLPDSLLTTFFPKLAEYPGRLDEFRTYRSSRNSVYYLVVLKDVGAKGHLLNQIWSDGIYVTDIVKSGNSCPEDTTVYYPIILLADSPDWDGLNHPIIKTTYASDKWNCDKPETLTKIEPYGEWIISTMYNYDEYVKLFGKE